MPELKWNEYDFIECLGVLPEIDDYETGHHFRVEKDSVVLVLSIWQYDRLFEISLYQSEKESPFVSFYLSVRDQVGYVNDKRGSYLVFQDCSVISSNHSRTKSYEFYDSKTSQSLSLILAVEPQIKLEFGDRSLHYRTWAVDLSTIWFSEFAVVQDRQSKIQCAELKLSKLI